MELLQEAQALQKRLVGWRRALHQHAEVGLDLPWTAAFVEARLEELCVPHRRLTGSGVVAWLGRGEQTLLLRADMDALPGQESSGLSFACGTGATHACGHDIHTTMLLGAATLLRSHEGILRCRTVLMFQPGEECMTGAQQMVDAGLLEEFTPACALAMHVNVTDVPPGHIWIKQGAFMAASDLFKVTVEGRRGHGAHPHNAVSPIYAAIQIINAFTDLSRYEVAPMTPSILTVCSLHAGEAGNVIPDSCIFRGTLRTLDAGVRDQVVGRMRVIVEDVARAYRCSARLEFQTGIPPTVNDPKVSAWVREELEALLGVERVASPVMPSLGSEDFAVISSRVPSCYMSVGIPRVAGCTVPLHSEKIIFDEEYIHLGPAAFAALALTYPAGYSAL